MPIEIKWTDTDPETGQRRYLYAHKFAGQWHFESRPSRRGEWTKEVAPTLEMWEHILDSLRRRYRRREGVSDEDVDRVTKIVAELRQRRSDEEE
jgi:hypothetical protein